MVTPGRNAPPPRVKWHATRGGLARDGRENNTRARLGGRHLRTTGGLIGRGRRLQGRGGRGGGESMPAGGSGHHPSVGVPAGTGRGGGGSPSLYVALEMVAGRLSPFPLDFPHKRSKQSQSRPSASGSRRDLSP